MIENLTNSLGNCEEVWRVNIDFEQTENSFDNFIGWDAHIKLLENWEMLWVLFWNLMLSNS